ncbi:hypothetical protein [Actinomadura sp. 6N118]|uniref:hypothetical protein n=1 Tax=Actinomadura sp. 6N118 TaxID=3375151 RepID=UPI0037A21252
MGIGGADGTGQAAWAGKAVADLTCEEISDALTYLAHHHPADETLTRALADRLADTVPLLGAAGTR